MSDETAAAEAPAVVNPLDQLVERYVQLRDRKADIVAAHKKEVAKYDEALTKIENYLLAQFNKMGVESVRTGHGTAYISNQTSATVADWDQALAWIQENEHWAMLEKRVSKGFVEAYKEQHNDLPPGINWRAEKVVNVRRS